MGIPNHLTCLLRNLYAGQEATVRAGTTDWLQIGKWVRQGCILSPCLLNLYAEYVMRDARLDEAQTGIKIAGRNISNHRYADDTILMAEKWRRTKEPLDENERREWKSWLKTQHSENEDHGIWSHHLMANRWETMETVREFSFLGFKTTADGNCSHEIKRFLLLGRKAVTKKQRHYFADKGSSSQSYGFSSNHVWMWELDYKEIWALKNWCFWTVVLKIPWTARRSN